MNDYLNDRQRQDLSRLRTEALAELTGNILPFYSRHAIDEQYGGFVGAIDKEGRVVPDAPKSAVLNTRILWTFARAHRLFAKAEYLAMAERAFDYLQTYFWDARYSGVFGLLDAQGNPIRRSKNTYAQVFAMFAFAEFYRATGNSRSLERAVEIHHLLENHSHDRAKAGYVDGRRRTWARGWKERIGWRTGPQKTMNTHLHLLEAYTALLIAWPDEDLRACQTKLVGLILDRFFNPAADHFHQDFDDDWRLQSDEISYGHDLETCWLLTEVADLLGDSLIQARVHEIAGRVARATLAEAIDQDGAVFYQGNAAGIADRQKIWWAQAEAVVGFLDSFERSGDDAFLQAALGIWQFIQEQLVDRRLGEWRTGIDLLDTFQELDVKIGAMKGPYHNGRACMEIIARVDRMNSHQS